MSKSERLDRLWLWDFVTTLFARAPRIVVPEIEHGLAEMLDDVAAIEIDVFHQRAAFFAIKNDVLMFARWPATLDYHADCVRRSHRRMRNIWWNKERFSLPHEMIDNPIAFAYPHFDVAFELIKIFLRIDQMKIVPRVRPLDHHHEKVAAIVKITITHRRLEFVSIVFNPLLEINR